MELGSKDIVIAVNNLCKTFKSLKAVDNLDLKIFKGQFVALLGPNGAGKTTLIEMIEGIQSPNSGTIEIFGKTWKQSPALLHEKIGIALQETRFTDKLTVKETLKLFQSFYKKTFYEIHEIIKVVGLDDKADTYCAHLSGGQRQKLALGVALINQPEVLLLDEPTTGLDPHARKEIWEILLKRKQENSTMILTTHYMEEAERLCDKILIMNKGKIIAQGSLEELLSQNNAAEIIEFESSRQISKEKLLETEGAIDIHLEPGETRGTLKVEDLTCSLPSFISLMQHEEMDLKSLQARKMTLNDLFVDMTGRQLNE